MIEQVANSDENSWLTRVEDTLGKEPGSAADRLREYLTRKPFEARAYSLLDRAVRALGERTDMLGHVRAAITVGDQAIDAAERAIGAKDFPRAGAILSARLRERPADVEALCLMAELAYELSFEPESENLLRLAREFAPNSAEVRVELARVLSRRDKHLEARSELEAVLALDPGNLFAMVAYAAALGRSGQYDEAAKLYEELLQRLPDESALWTTYGHLLKTMGRAEEGLRAMRRATQLAPANGEAWWNIANLKTAPFDATEIATMQAVLDRRGLGPYDRSHIHFTLGKAHEDAGDPAEAFAHYQQANAIRRQLSGYDPEAITAEVDASIQLFSRRFFEQRAGWGAIERAPVFVVGMPRAGSTLVEQILASHPSIEGTRELLGIPNIAVELGCGRGDYFGTVAQLGREQCRSLGVEYIARTMPMRATDRPFFVDKMPDNWLHVGLIHLLLPHAKIIDARRHPLACGISNFKQNYIKSHLFSYDLTAIGHHYREYVRLMAHFDVALPGRVHRVIHERLVDDTETEIRRLLDYLELPFDAACLRFHETRRAVRTPSSEQVRRPIHREGVDQWRAFEPWLDGLKTALGPVLDSYPEVPNYGSE